MIIRFWRPGAVLLLECGGISFVFMPRAHTDYTTASTRRVPLIDRSACRSTVKNTAVLNGLQPLDVFRTIHAYHEFSGFQGNSSQQQTLSSQQYAGTPQTTACILNKGYFRGGFPLYLTIASSTPIIPLILDNAVVRCSQLYHPIIGP